MLSPSCIPLIQLDSTNKLKFLQVLVQAPSTYLFSRNLQQYITRPKIPKISVAKPKKKTILQCKNSGTPNDSTGWQFDMLALHSGKFLLQLYYQLFPNVVQCNCLQKLTEANYCKILNCPNLTGFESYSNQSQLPIKIVVSSCGTIAF